MRKFVPLLLLLPAACAAPAAPDPTVWVGRRESALVSILGVPDRVYEQDGRRVLSYDRAGPSGVAVRPSLGIGIGGFSYGGGRATGFGTGLGLGLGGGSANCTVSYDIRQGEVIGATQAGPGCG
jgi:hypothetical protein